MIDAQQVENYVEEPGRHFEDARAPLWRGDAAIRSAMFFESLINSPPIFILDNPVVTDGGRPGHIATGWAPRLEATLSWAAAIGYGAPSQLNFAWDPPAVGDADHVAAQASYGNFAKQITAALFPDVTTGLATPLAVSASFSSCPGAVHGAGLRQPWGGSPPEFCAFYVLINACAVATVANVELGGAPPGVSYAHRVFGGPYTNHTLQGGAAEGVVIDGYATLVLRVGCPGWTPVQ